MSRLVGVPRPSELHTISHVTTRPHVAIFDWQLDDADLSGLTAWINPRTETEPT